MTGFCLINHSLYKKPDLLWFTLGSLLSRCKMCSLPPGNFTKCKQSVQTWIVEDFQGTIQTFANNRGDFLVTVVKCDDKTLGIINCHRTCKGSKDEFIYLVDVFSAVVRLQTGGKDARDIEWDAVDAIALAGDFNLKNVYYGKSVDRNYDPKEPKNKIQILLCYLLFPNLVPNEWQDKNRGYEIDYLYIEKFQISLYC
uniref:Endonuclease/exonuclease/phosphatase domain-containing protein n=1 Tax=Tetranychus urticae TaxID=32264 RepID=T1K3C8_TETUR